jgi:hypothetical protein
VRAWASSLLGRPVSPSFMFLSEEVKTCFPSLQLFYLSFASFATLVYMHTPLIPQRMTKSEFFSELRAPDAAAIRSRPSNWDLNSSRPMIRRGRLTKRHPSPLATSVSDEDVSTLRDKTHSGNTHPLSSSAPPSFRINHYGMLSQENLPIPISTPNPDTSINTSHNLKVSSLRLSKKRRSLRDDMHASSCFACCSGFSKK